MEDINSVELCDEDVYPDDSVLEAVLGPGYPAFRNLMAMFDGKGMTHEWRYYRDGKAWLCKVQFKKRTIVWMSAWNHFMKATVYVPLSKLERVMELDIQEAVRQEITATKNVGKSKPCIFEIRGNADLVDLEKVVDLKILMK